MTNRNDLAYPIIETASDPETGRLSDHVYKPGLTKRELFAAMAMQGLMSNPERYKYITDAHLLDELSQEELSSKNAHKAVCLADALIKELNK